MNKVAINTHAKKRKMSLESCDVPHPSPSLCPKPKSQISALHLEEAPVWCPLAPRGRPEPERVIHPIRVSTELALLPTAGSL